MGQDQTPRNEGVTGLRCHMDPRWSRRPSLRWDRAGLVMLPSKLNENLVNKFSARWFPVCLAKHWPIQKSRRFA